MQIWLIALFSGIALITSFFSVLIGGAGLILTPLMLSFGIPPINAISSAKFSFLGTSTSGTIKFHKAHKIDYKVAIPLAAFAITGGIIGSNSVMKLNPVILQAFTGVFLILILILTYVLKDFGIKEHHMPLTFRRYLFAGVVMLFGIVITTVTGGGSSVITVYVLVLLFGENFLHSAGTQSIINDLSLFAITLVFLFHGMIYWPLAIPLFLSNLIGAWLGSNYGLSKGVGWARNVFMVVICILSLKLILPLFLGFI